MLLTLANLVIWLSILPIGQILLPTQVAALERRSSKCAVAPLMSQSRERDTTGTAVVKAQPNLNPKGSGGQQQG
jgi:hypothetical protein